MGIYEELKARGLIAQVTDEEQIRDLVNNGKATFYIGFDCTADSLHVGHFMALCLMKRLQMAGNKPIALIGGGTTMIGDPSGRNDMRKMLTKADIDHNAECFKRQMERFIDFGEGKAIMLNNADWLLKLNYVDLLRDDIWKNHPEIHIVDFDFYDVEAFNQCENNNCVLMAVENWKYVHPLLKILPVDWGYTIPFGLLHAPEPSPTVERFLRAVEKAVKM